MDQDNQKLLDRAIQNGNWGEAVSLFKKGAFVGETYVSFLIQVIENDSDVEFIKTLLKLNPSVNIKNEKGLTPLHAACKKKSNNQLEIIEALLHHDADINCTDNDQITPLHLGCDDLNLELVTFLLKKGARPSIKDENGETPLHLVCRYEDDVTTSIIKLLLEHGADIEAVDNKGWTPLFTACLKVNYSAVKCLLENQANPHAMNPENEIPLHVACWSKYKMTVPVIKLLLEYGSNIEAADAKGGTPLFTACKVGDEDVIECLLDNHANPHHIDSENVTLLHIAVKFHPLDSTVVDILLDNNVNIHGIDNCGRSVIHYVVEHNATELIEIFAFMNVNFNSIDKEGNTPLHIAAKRSYDVLTEDLIRYGADVNILSKNNKTPLQEAMDVVCPLDYSDSSFLLRQWRTYVIDMLSKQVVKLKVAGLKVHQQNLDIIYDLDDGNLTPRKDFNNKKDLFDVQRLEVECQQEIEKIKKESIGINNLTFYDLLTKHIHLLSTYGGKQKIKQILKKDDLYKKSPLYLDIIRSRIREATIRYERNKVMDATRKYFRLNISERLPDECIDMVLDYLNIGELELFVQAIKSLKVTQPLRRSLRIKRKLISKNFV